MTLAMIVAIGFVWIVGAVVVALGVFMLPMDSLNRIDGYEAAAIILLWPLVLMLSLCAGAWCTLKGLGRIAMRMFKGVA